MIHLYKNSSIHKLVTFWGPDWDKSEQELHVLIKGKMCVTRSKMKWLIRITKNASRVTQDWEERKDFE